MNQTAETTYRQLGNKAMVMMGAFNKSYSDDGSISFKIKGSRKFNYIKIALNSMDLYDITFMKVGKFDIKNEKTVNDIYADMMRSLIEKETGLYLSL